MRRTTHLLSLAALAGALTATLAPSARAGDFTVKGEYAKDPSAVAFLDFESEPSRYLPPDADPACAAVAYKLSQADDALETKGFATVQVNLDKGCAERFNVTLPSKKASYRATAWIRHGRASLTFVVLYQDGSGLVPTYVAMGPTGRTTSDGWVEMASNPFSVDGGKLAQAYIKVTDFAGTAGADIDAVEIVPAGAFAAQQACSGISDPVCGADSMCVHGICARGNNAVPPLPGVTIKDAMVDAIAERLRVYFGGARSRKERLPEALATVETMRKAESGWQFWGRFARAVTELTDWHTNIGLGLGIDPRYSLHACFIEGDADLTHKTYPKDPQYSDILVSHASSGGAAGLSRGDRLLAIDGQHPIAWARALRKLDPGFHAATDPEVHADLVEALGGPAWMGNLIVKYASTITVIRCDAAAGTCAGAPETIQVASLTDGSGGDVFCDNRPFYHLGAASPGDNHAVFWPFFEGVVDDTTPEEAIYGVVWDNLYGGGDPNGFVNGNLKTLIAKWKASARGVLLDHRAGNGGTLDSPTLLTTLVRPPGIAATILMPIETAGFDGPADANAGFALFEANKTKTPYNVGSADYDPDLPVALILHRDGSASDYLPLGMKGSPKVRLFGPHATAGAFSTYVQLSYEGVLDFQIASGDTIRADGQALIGHGVEPDEVVQQRQSDLLAGKDSLHEAALAWVRAHLKETP
ncbi:MAG: S41 family peptidase [Polyangiaceae bacterium]